MTGTDSTKRSIRNANTPPRQHAAKQFRLKGRIEGMGRNSAVVTPAAAGISRTAIRHDPSSREVGQDMGMGRADTRVPDFANSHKLTGWLVWSAQTGDQRIASTTLPLAWPASR